MLSPSQQIEIILLLDQINEEYKQKQLGYQLMIQTKLKSSLIFLIRCYDQAGVSGVSIK